MTNLIRSMIVAMFLYGPSVNGQTPADLQSRGYKGPVKTVVTEHLAPGSHLKPPKRVRSSIERFDSSGRLYEEIVYTQDGSVLYADRHFFDRAGRREYTLTKHSRFVYLPDKTVYTYDSRGFLIATRGYATDGRLLNENNYVFNDAGLKTRWTSHSHHPEEHSKPHRRDYRYDLKGRCVEERAFVDDGGGFRPTDTLGGPHRKLYMYAERDKPVITLLFQATGEFAGVETVRYDNKGNEIEEIAYDSSGVLEYLRKYSYERIDRHANWTRQIISVAADVSDPSRLSIEEVTVLTIAYHRLAKRT